MPYLLIAIGFGIVALWLLMRRTSAPFPEKHPEVVITAGDAATPASIPRVVWSYWHTDELPLLVRHCLANWRKFATGYEVRMLSPDRMSEYLDPASLPAGYGELPAYRKADWLRLALLRRHGGIWLDASLFLTAPLDWVQEFATRHEIGYVGFFIDKFTVDRARPVIENWFMAACPSHPFIEALYAEFTRRILEGGGAEAYLAALRESGEYTVAVQRINQPDYLIMHVACGRLLRKGDYRLCLLRAEDLAFYYPALFGWSKTALYLHLAVYRANARLPGVIKFRSGDRNYFQRRLRLGLYSRHSVVGRYLLSLKQSAVHDRSGKASAD